VIRLLDTNICVPLINRTEPALRERLLAHRPDEIVLCSIVKAELAFGARNSIRVAENLDRLQRFCSAFQSFGFDDAAADHYGSVRALLSREGRLIGSNDLLIAAIALSRQAQLVTRNVGEFSRVPGLRVEAW
jgi:tRNA(fMet)-specific endonuclease VapC